MPDPVLDRMIEEMERSPALYRPSQHWAALNAEHLGTLLSPDGFAHFKRTLNDSYFQFGLYAFPRAIAGLGARWIPTRDLSVLRARFEGRTSVKYGPLLARAIALYADAVAALPGGERLWELNEPALGDPMMVRWGRRRTTQDLAHSVEEIVAIANGLPSVRFERVAELGAGYGRVAWAWARLMPETQYFVIDIPPALYVAQRYLTTVLGDIQAFRFRPFTNFADVAAEIERSRLVFLLPSQLELLPDRYLDLVLTISSLHEMRRDQISNYLRLIDAKCARAFYLKQWRRWRNARDGIEVTQDDYGMSPSWNRVFVRSPLLPREFFEALYVRRRD